MINDTEEVCLLENWTLDISMNDTNSGPIQIQDPFESVWMKFIAILSYFIGLITSAIMLAFINYEKEHHGNFRSVINQLLSNLYAMVSHEGLCRCRENSFPFFVYQNLKEILIRYSRII